MLPNRLVTWILAASVTLAAPLHELHKRAGVVPTLSGPQNPIGAGTYPRANTLGDGSIIAAYTGFADGNSIINLARSTDGGASWTFVGTAAQGPQASTDIDNPYPLQLPSGRILVAYRNHSRRDASTYDFFRITISYSDDNGVTWSYLSDPASDPGPVNGNWEPFLRNAADGSLQLYYARENSAADQDNLMRTSNDGGVTWSGAQTISGGDSSAQRDGMIGVATIDGANLIAVFETGAGNPRTYTINSITSADDGATWGNRQQVYIPTGVGNNAGDPQVVNVGGTIVVCFGTDEDTSLHDWSPVPQGADAKIITSGDGGRTWGNKLTFTPVQSTWPALLALDGNSFLALADHNGASAQRVTLG